MIKLRYSRNENGLCFIAPADNYKIATRKLTIHPENVEKHCAGIQTMLTYYELAQSKIKTNGIGQ